MDSLDSAYPKPPVVFYIVSKENVERLGLSGVVHYQWDGGNAVEVVQSPYGFTGQAAFQITGGSQEIARKLSSGEWTVIESEPEPDPRLKVQEGL